MESNFVVHGLLDGIHKKTENNAFCGLGGSRMTEFPKMPESDFSVRDQNVTGKNK